MILSVAWYPGTVCASLESNYPALLFEEGTFTGNVGKETTWGKMVMGTRDSALWRDYMSAGSEHSFVSKFFVVMARKNTYKERNIEEKGSKREKMDKLRLTVGIWKGKRFVHILSSVLCVRLRFWVQKSHKPGPVEKVRLKIFTELSSYALSDHSSTHQDWGQFHKNLSYQQISHQKSKFHNHQFSRHSLICLAICILSLLNSQSIISKKCPFYLFKIFREKKSIQRLHLAQVLGAL